MKSTLMHLTPTTGASALCAAISVAPNAAAQGTGLPFAGTSAVALAAVAGVRTTDLPGSPPRGAPV